MTTETPTVDREVCSGCGECVETCPSEALEVIEGKATIVRPDDCDDCGECAVICPEGAIESGFEILFEEGA